MGWEAVGEISPMPCLIVGIGDALKVTRKPAGNDTIWSELDRTIPLPDAALNVTARSVPNDFVMLGLDIVPTSDIVMGPPSPPPD